MQTKYAVTFNGRIRRVTKTLGEALGSTVYHPWNGGQIFEIEYSAFNCPIKARII